MNRNNWQYRKLEDICEIIMGQSPPSDRYNSEKKGLPFYQGKAEFGDVYPTPRKWCSKPLKLAEKNDILISVRAPVGPTNICNETSCIGRGLAAIRYFVKDGHKFIFYYLRSIESEIANIGTGSTFSAISKSQISNLKIPLPPLPEQHRIVAKIEELFTRLDAGIEALKKVKEQLKRYRQGVLKYAFEGKLTQERREANKGKIEPASVLLERIKEERKKSAKGKYKELPPIDTSDLPELPEGWAWTALPNLGGLNRGKSKHRPRDDKRLFDGDYPFIQTGDVKNSKGIIKTYNQTYNEFGLSQSKLWPVNTLCITIAANIANTAILGIPACFPDSVVGFIADEKICEVKYIHYFMRTIKDRLESFAPATAQKNINLETLRNVVVPLASPLEQQKIVEEVEGRLSITDNLENMAEQSLKQSERLRQSILKRAFEGKLVPQDPTDEPADKLLERIKEEKVKREGENRREKKHRNKNSKQMELI
jgi:type I restriction enzyme S subunit